MRVQNRPYYRTKVASEPTANGENMKTLKTIGVILVVLVVSLSGYEYIKVSRAQAKTDELFKSFKSPDFSGLKWSDLQDWQKSALIKVEDPGFFSHNGVDLGSKGAGLTTITQAIVKRLYFEHFTPGFKKIEQTLIARYAVSPVIPKEVQLTAFLNVTYFGTEGSRDVIGFADAAQTYFNKPFAQIDQEEYLKLVAMLIAPNDLKPLSNNEKSRTRVARMKKLIAGQCEAQSLRDVYLEACD